MSKQPAAKDVGSTPFISDSALLQDAATTHTQQHAGFWGYAFASHVPVQGAACNQCQAAAAAWQLMLWSAVHCNSPVVPLSKRLDLHYAGH
jgi:hypothetical protein